MTDRPELEPGSNLPLPFQGSDNLPARRQPAPVVYYPEEEESISLEHYLHILQRRKWMLAAIAATFVVLAALHIGMRRGEIFKLRWNDLDFNRGFILIRDPKGGKSQKIPMNSATRDLLESIQQVDDYIFPARGGGPRKDISKDSNRIKQAARLPKDFRPLHGLRHLYATMLANSGKVDMYTLQKLMTHKSPQMTQRYAHYRDEALRRASGQVDDILAEAMQVNNKVTVIK